ncbi:fungal-specific transcription factor domain-containing protein [Desarmillaria tabescens]|uniref:Fungal-specific transcription factor domain-containing protein n=1 Tax=Armillaria tabescens TaxID=1929756 RepID=A0AA39K1L6_ARMTA|nr:fungal-specific transcription factor domain-containing protein [Desarmillaria tabescens]KAK0452932.1 fungal-specific transcription factor domain-containing protein [Desarmillaria tabescens]
MKCDFPLNEKACKRCKPKGYQCVVEAPKPKVYKRERLLAEIRQKDAVIESLIKQLYDPYRATPHSINEYLKSISPSDANDPNVLVWLDRLNSSVQIGTGISSNFLHGGDEEHHDSLSHGRQEHERTQFALMESPHVPDRPPDLMFPSWKENERQRKDAQHGIAWHSEACEGYSEHGSFDHSRFAHGILRPGLNLSRSKEFDSPDILVLGLVTLDDAEQLFDIFYKYINPFISILDPILLTPKSTLTRSPVLFAVICAISCRYYAPKASIYPLAMRFAKHSAANALIHDEMKSIELCQAYILMSMYAVPQKSWDRDQSWLYTGLAISIATALHLDRTPKIDSANEKEEREALNRVRVWQLCFYIDRGTAIQFGKLWMMKEDTIIRHSEEWYKQSQYNLDYDVHMCGYNALLRIVARFHEEVLKLDQSELINSERRNLRDITMRYDVEIEVFEEEWKKKFRAGGFSRGAMLRCGMLNFFVAYFRLVMFSFGFHQVFHAGIENWYDYFFSKSLECSKLLIRCVNEDLAPSGFLRYAPDRNFLCVAFAAVFLFKILRPEFSSLLGKADKDESIKLIETLIDQFSSSGIAVDDRHTPKLYARFLATLLSKYRYNCAQAIAIGALQNTLPKDTGIPMCTAGEMGGDHGTYQRSQTTQDHNHDSAGYQWPQLQIPGPEASHAAGIWPVQFGSGMEFLYFTHEGENIGNGGAESLGSMPEGGVLTSIQGLNNSEWLREMLMPGYGFSDYIIETLPNSLLDRFT